MSRPLLVLHAGPHKTGSTALQMRLAAERAHLQAHGFDYPELGLFHGGHHYLRSWLNGNLADAGNVSAETLAALAGEGRSLIFSSEDLVYVTPENLARLRAPFAGWRIEVVLFLRSPVGLWPSHWQELVKHGSAASLLEYVATQFGFTTLFDPRSMQPQRQVQRFAQVFGRRQVRVFCYDNVVAEGVDLFDFFVERILGLPPVLPRRPTRAYNMSVPPDTVEILRSLNERAAGKGLALTAAYWRKRAEIEASEPYAAFRAGFEQHARALTLACDQDVFRRHERMMLGMIGDRIENAAGPERLFTQDLRRAIPYGTPYWVDRVGLGSVVDQLLQDLS